MGFFAQMRLGSDYPLRPYPSRSKLCALAREDGLIVTHEDDKIAIDNCTIALSFGDSGDSTDTSDRVYSGQKAFGALGIELR